MAKGKKLKLPKDIWVGGAKWSVSTLPLLPNDVMGQTLSGSQSFLFSEKYMEDKNILLDTMLHEILHGICRVWDTDLGDKEEGVVSKIASGLTAIFVHNPEIINFIKEASKK